MRAYPRHRHQEFLRFLKKVAAAQPGVELHIVADNYATHEHPEVRTWLARPEKRRITLHFTPTGCSWLNMVEIFFGIITRQAIRRGTFRSVKELTTAIGAFIDAYNTRCQPFAWTKTSEDILTRAGSQRSHWRPGQSLITWNYGHDCGCNRQKSPRNLRGTSASTRSTQTQAASSPSSPPGPATSGAGPT